MYEFKSTKHFQKYQYSVSRKWAMFWNKKLSGDQMFKIQIIQGSFLENKRQMYLICLSKFLEWGVYIIYIRTKSVLNSLNVTRIDRHLKTSEWSKRFVNTNKDEDISLNINNIDNICYRLLCLTTKGMQAAL